MGITELSSKRVRAVDYADYTDDELLALMQRDDTGAYRTLVERHIDRAYGVALRVIKNAADAEDVTQDAFVKAWQKRYEWQSGRAKFSTWLYRVIVNRCIDKLRVPDCEWIENVPEPADDSEDALSGILRQRLYVELEQALSELPSLQRLALTLSYHEALSCSEVSEVMGTTLYAVESLLKRGKQGLRKLMARSEIKHRIKFDSRGYSSKK